jgi:hypothetical protein
MTAGTAKKKTNWNDPTIGKWFYVAMAIACMIVSIASFAPSLLDRSARLGTFTWVTLIHGLSSSGWLIVFVLQTMWVRTKRLSLHRTLGTASLALAAAMVVFGYATVISMTRRGFDFSGDLHLNGDPSGPIGQMIFPLLDIFEFGLLVAAGYIFRRRAAAHKRLMLFAAIALLPAPFAHLIGHYPSLVAKGPAVIVPLLFVSLFASPVYDLIRFRRIHPVSLILAPAMFIADMVSAIIIGPGEAWHRFGTWLIS